MLRHVSWADNLGWLNKSFCGRIEFKDWKAHILALASSHCSSKPEGCKKTVSFCLIWRITTRKISRERARRASALPTRPLRCKPSSSSQPSTRLKFGSSGQSQHNPGVLAGHLSEYEDISCACTAHRTYILPGGWLYLPV